MTGRLGLQLRLNQSIGMNRRVGQIGHSAAVQRAARPRKALGPDGVQPVLRNSADRGSGRVAGHFRIR